MPVGPGAAPVGLQSAGVSTGGNTAGATSVISGQLILAGGNNITLSEATGALGAATVTISGANQSNQTEGLYAVGNTTGQSSSTTIDARSLSFDGAGNISVGFSGGSVVISQTGGGGGGNFSAGVSNIGNTSGNTGTTSNQIVLAGGNNITLSESTAAGGITVTISGPNTAAQSNQTLDIYASGNTTGNSSSLTYDARSLTMEFDGIVSGGWSTNNSHLLISASQSVQTVGAYAVGNTTTSTSSMTADARSLSFDGAGIVSVGMSGGSVVISASDAAQSNQTEGIYATGNTTGNSSSLTIDARSLTIEFDGIVSGGWSTNNSHLIISGAGAGGTFGMSNIGNTSGTSSMVTNQIVFAGGNNITLSESTAAGGVTLTISAFNQSNQTEGFYALGHTAGQSSSTTLDARTISLNATQGDLSVGYSGGSIVLSDAILSQWSFGPLAVGPLTTTRSLGQGTLSLIPLVVPRMFVGSVGHMFASLNLNVANMAFFTSTSTTFTGTAGTTINWALYSLGSGASSSAIFTMSSISATFSASASVSQTANSITANMTIGYPNGISNSTSFSTNSTTLSTTTTFGGNSITAANVIFDNNWASGKNVFFPCVTTLGASNYLLGVQGITTGTACGPAISFMEQAPVLSYQGYIGASSNTTAPAYGFGAGNYSASFSTALQSKVALTDINTPTAMPFGFIVNMGS